MSKEVVALTVSQWLPTWEETDFDPEAFRRKPIEQFLLFSMEASALRRLIGIQRRTSATGAPRTQDLGIQRAHDKDRSSEIASYVQRGFPWSKLSERRRKSGKFDDLIKPGWLPTAVVINILLPEDERNGKTVDSRDLVTIDFKGSTAIVKMPDIENNAWAPTAIPPVEVIDGQHRLWAFNTSVPGYQVPVVAFYGLDRSWQAYLFYTINISPKRINSSLAFDLYPLLRTEDWLERFEGHHIYRESRAQELTEALWSHPESPWHRRINMLGERGTKMVTQNAWVRSLTATFIKRWEERRRGVGGLFGAPVGENRLVLPWTRAQQAAFLIYVWRALASMLDELDPSWTRELGEPKLFGNLHVGMESSNSMLNSDMGVRGLLYIANDLCFARASSLELSTWQEDYDAAATSDEAVSQALVSLARQPVGSFLDALAGVLALYDWRSSKAPGLKPELRERKARFRGSGGYRELRQELLQFVRNSGGELGEAAAEVMTRLDYDS